MKRCIFLMAILFFCGQAFGQELPPQKKRSTIKIEQKGKATYFLLSGNFNYPNETTLSLALRYKEGVKYLKWYRVQLKDKKFSTKLGPFRKKLLPGTYVLEVWFKLVAQPPHLARILRGPRYKYSAYYSRKVDEVSIIFQKDQRKKVFKAIGQRYLDNVKKLEQLYEKTNKAFHWENVKKRGDLPSLEKWNQLEKDNMAVMRGLYLNLRKWKGGYECLVKSYWIGLIKDLCGQLYKLGKSYRKFYNLEGGKKGSPKAKLLKKHVYYCKGLRTIFEASSEKLKREIEVFLNPKTETKGEKGVE